MNCFATEVIFGPEQFERSKGKPSLDIHSFYSAHNGTGTLIIHNGMYADETIGERVTSSTITLNGEKIVAPSEFNSETTYIEKDVSLLEGDNLLGVLLAGKPASTLLLSIQLDTVRSIPVPGGPVGVAITPTGNWAYVTNYKNDTVAVLQTSSNTITQTIDVGRGPNYPVASPNGEYIYVANGFSNSVYEICTSTNTVTDTLRLRGH